MVVDACRDRSAEPAGVGLFGWGAARIGAVVLAVLLAGGLAQAASPLLLVDAVPGAKRYDSVADLLKAWDAAGLRGVTLVRLANHDGFFDPEKERPAVDAIRTLLREGKQEELRRRSLPFPLKGRLLTPRNHVQAAWLLGYVKELVWVVPRLRSLTADNFKDLQGYFATFDAASAASLQFKDGVIGGFFLGMPVRICTLLEGSSLADLDAAVEINTDFISALYANPTKQSLLSLVSDITKGLEALRINGASVGVTDSRYGGFSPLYHDFVSDALLSLIREPGLLKQPVDSRWLAFTRALEFESLGAVDEAIRVVREIADADRGAAYPQYFIGTVLFRRKKIPEAIEWLVRAYTRDQRYLEGFVEWSGIAQKGGNPELALCLLEKAAALEPEHPTALYMLGNTALHDQRWADAVRYYERFMKVTAEYPEILEIVKRSRTEKRPDKGRGPGKQSGTSPCGKR